MTRSAAGSNKSESSFSKSHVSNHGVKGESKNEPKESNVENKNASSTYSNDKRKSPNCKLCSGQHSMYKCRRYGTHEARKQRCTELGLCIYCTSSNHASNKCKGNLDFKCNVCSSNTHVAAMCSKFKSYVTTNLSVNVAQGSLNGNSKILPTITVFLGGKKKTKARFLVDGGSQTSWMSGEPLKRIQAHPRGITQNVGIRSYLDAGNRRIKECLVPTSIDGGKNYLNCTFSIDNDFDLSMKIPSLSVAVDNVRKTHKLADASLLNNSDLIELDGVLGTDIIDKFNIYEKIKHLNGSLYRCDAGYMLMGDVDNFLTDAQLDKKYSQFIINRNRNTK